jgi:hypothetical protein
MGGSEILTDPTTTVSMIKDFIDGLHWEEFPDGVYQPTYVDQHLRSIHAYHNLVIMEKGSNVEGSYRGRTKRPAVARHRQPPAAHPIGAQRAQFSVPPICSDEPAVQAGPTEFSTGPGRPSHIGSS